jgi:hypothetical protein
VDDRADHGRRQREHPHGRRSELLRPGARRGNPLRAVRRGVCWHGPRALLRRLPDDRRIDDLGQPGWRYRRRAPGRCTQIRRADLQLDLLQQRRLLPGRWHLLLQPLRRPGEGRELDDHRQRGDLGREHGRRHLPRELRLRSGAARRPASGLGRARLDNRGRELRRLHRRRGPR